MPQLTRTERFTFLSFLILMVVSLLLGVYVIKAFLIAIVMGILLAILMEPLKIRLGKWGLPQKFSVPLIILFILIMLFGPLLFIASQVVKQAIMVAQQFAGSQAFSLNSIISSLNSWEPAQVLIGNPEQLEERIRQFIGSGLTTLSTGILNGLSNIPDLVVKLVTALFVCYALLNHGDRILSWFGRRVPLSPEVKQKLTKSIHDTSISVVWATLAAALSQVVVISIGFIVLGVPAVFLAAGATFVFAWIPVLGCSPVWLAASIYLFVQGSVGKTILMVLIGLFAGIVDNIVRPLVLRGRDEMNPAISLIAIFGALDVFGIVGVFIGPIIAAFIIRVLELWPHIAEENDVIIQSSPVSDSVGTVERTGHPKQS